MKFVKSISLFVVYPLITAACGFALGLGCSHFYYKGKMTQNAAAQEILLGQEILARQQAEKALEQMSLQMQETLSMSDADISNETTEVAALKETLSVDTEYVLEEMDIDDHTSVETIWRLPSKYVGMDREQFLEAMELYEAFPPLTEQERGFVGLEVLSFSRDRVVIQMNYRYVQPGDSYYLAVKDHEVVVYLEDQETIYMYTGINLEQLPDHIL